MFRLPYQKKTLVSSLCWRGTRVHDLQLSGSLSRFVSSLDWTSVLLFFFSPSSFIIQGRSNFHYMPVTKAISSSSPWQQHAVLYVKRGSQTVSLTTEGRLCLKELASMEGFMSCGLKMLFQRPFHPSKKYIYVCISPGGNTGLKCVWICHLLFYRVMYKWEADHDNTKSKTHDIPL